MGIRGYRFVSAEPPANRVVAPRSYGDSRPGCRPIEQFRCRNVKQRRFQQGKRRCVYKKLTVRQPLSDIGRPGTCNLSVDCFGQLPFGGIALFAKSGVTTLGLVQFMP